MSEWVSTTSLNLAWVGESLYFFGEKVVDWLYNVGRKSLCVGVGLCGGESEVWMLSVLGKEDSLQRIFKHGN